jgi:hypothetical protein
MSRRTKLAMILFGLSTLGACGHRAQGNRWEYYSVATAARSDSSEPGHGEWFTRWIYTQRGATAIELVYCPFANGQPQPCRTTVVWNRGESDLLPGSENADQD